MGIQVIYVLKITISIIIIMTIIKCPYWFKVLLHCYNIMLHICTTAFNLKNVGIQWSAMAFEEKIPSMLYFSFFQFPWIFLETL